MIRVNKGMGCYKVKGRWKLVYIIKCFGYLVLIIFVGCGEWVNLNLVSVFFSI